MILRTLLGCCALLLAGINTADAVVLNPRGEGQLLIFPYYNTAAGNITLLTVINYREQAKVLRVRIAEGENGQDVGSFHVYLGPYDVWTATLFDVDLGGGPLSGITTSDSSCTYPALRDSTTLPRLPVPDGPRYLPFSGGLTDAGSRDRTRPFEGFIEVLEVASVLHPSTTYDAITPRERRRDCGVVQAAWDAPDGYWRADPLKDLANPTGGIGGEVSVVNVPAGTVFGMAPTAIEDFRADPLDRPRGSLSSVALHRRPAPREAPLSTLALTDPASRTASADVIADGKPLRLSYPAPERAVDALSAVLMQNRVKAAFELDSRIGSHTSYVLTFPTRPLYTDEQYTNSSTGIAPFPARFAGRVPLESSLSLPMDLLDREARIVRTSWEPEGGCTSFCPTPVVARLPGTAVEVLSPSGGPDPLLGTRLHGEFRAGAYPSPVEENGWLLLRSDRLGGVPNQLRPSLEGYRLLGLPLIGTRIITYVNENAVSGVLANYSTALPMTGNVQCVDAQLQPCAP